MSDTLSILKEAWLAEFRKQKAYIEGALRQLCDEQFRARPSHGVNSCALIVKHLAGNLRSRWTDWRTSDGEKPGRDRDGEFEDRGEPREELMRRLEEGFGLVFAAIASLGEADLPGTVRIRCEPHSVPLAINRSLAHVAYHAGQIMIIARTVAGEAGWQWQTVRPGGSEAHNSEMERQFGR